jgi:hypothetical protein
MPKAGTKELQARERSKEKESIRRSIKKAEKGIAEKITELRKKRENCACFPLLMGESSITNSVVDDTFEELRTKYKDCDGNLDVVIDSPGGEIDAAYNLAMIFRKFGNKKLNFIVPRWAKSAATLLACSGNQIFMTPIAELGPLDPQITEFNPLENRLEQYSPLHIGATLDLIRDEFQNGHEKLAQGLLERLQFPMTLGHINKTLDIGKQYVLKLLESRMLSGDHGKSEEIADRLTKGYSDHGMCINADEARAIGLNVVDLEGDLLDLIMEIHKLDKQRVQLERKMRQDKFSEILEGLPPDLLDKLPLPLRGKIKPAQN